MQTRRDSFPFAILNVDLDKLIDLVAACILLGVPIRVGNKTGRRGYF
jgi:hypothetical protein